jgi:hypothetical protein
MNPRVFQQKKISFPFFYPHRVIDQAVLFQSPGQTDSKGASVRFRSFRLPMKVNAPIGVQSGMAVGFHLDWTVLTGFSSRQQKFFPQPGADSRGTQLYDLYPLHRISSFLTFIGIERVEVG